MCCLSACSSLGSPDSYMATSAFMPLPIVVCAQEPRAANNATRPKHKVRNTRYSINRIPASLQRTDVSVVVDARYHWRVLLVVGTRSIVPESSSMIVPSAAVLTYVGLGGLGH